jgi:hypothetical protein
MSVSLSGPATVVQSMQRAYGSIMPSVILANVGQCGGRTARLITIGTWHATPPMRVGSPLSSDRLPQLATLRSETALYPEVPYLVFRQCQDYRPFTRRAAGSESSGPETLKVHTGMAALRCLDPCAFDP